MSDTVTSGRPKFGLVGSILGLAALVVIMIQLSALFAPEVDDKSLATSIGEFAAEVRDSATRALNGEEAPPPEPAGPDYTEAITNIALIAAGLAAVLGIIGLFRSEPYPLNALAIGFGIGAIAAHYVMWLALLIAGAVILVAILNNIGDILGG